MRSFWINQVVPKTMTHGFVRDRREGVRYTGKKAMGSLEAEIGVM